MTLQEKLEQDWPGVFGECLYRVRASMSFVFKGHIIRVKGNVYTCRLSDGEFIRFMNDGTMLSYSGVSEISERSDVKTTYFDRFPESIDSMNEMQ